MKTSREAQHLNGADRGKHIRFEASFNRTLAGKLIQVKHLGDGNTTIVIQTDDGRLEWDHVKPETEVTITGRQPCANLYTASLANTFAMDACAPASSIRSKAQRNQTAPVVPRTQVLS
ncbi:hypothetical protein [Glutamicibacter sp. NPDC087344]|uniref:hypothetical protein n=1 Tax=Glutamicibacter sp. NPDC087344 TaxID=3363994 RepID=UPI0038077C78